MAAVGRSGPALHRGGLRHDRGDATGADVIVGLKSKPRLTFAYPRLQSPIETCSHLSAATDTSASKIGNIKLIFGIGLCLT